MITITNIRITPTGRAVPAYHQPGPERIPRQLLINCRNWPVHLTQVDNEGAEFTVPQPRPSEPFLLEDGQRNVRVDSSSQNACFSSLTTGYLYPESEIGICNEPYHDQTEAPHGPSRRCTQCSARFPHHPTASSLGHGQLLPPAMCAKCVPLTTSILKLDYPLAFSNPTAPMCDDCTATYLAVRAGRIPDPTGMPPLNVPCQCKTFLNHLATAWVCYRCKRDEYCHRTALARADHDLHRGITGGWRVKGTLQCAYLCKCGNAVLGDQAARRWARCVICERVVDSER